MLRLERCGLDPGVPGQFFMLEAPGRLLPRPMSLCLAPPRELGFLIDPVGPGTEALAALEPGDAIHVFGQLPSLLKAPLLVERSMVLVKVNHAGDHRKRFLAIWLSIAKTCSRII